MKIGIPRERKANEKRVGITPKGAARIVTLGHQVFLEKDAGLESGFLDQEYIDSGVTIENSLENLWCRSDLIMKVKEPAPEEYSFFRKDLIVYSFLHPAGSLELTQKILDGKIIGLDYDLIQTDDGQIPILEPMSKIAGILAVQCGTNYLFSQNEGKGILLDAIGPKTKGARVLVVGGGVSGLSAALRAQSLGADVTILDINENRLATIKKINPNLTLKLSNSSVISLELQNADLIIGAVLIPGAKAPTIITKELMESVEDRSVFVDISIDQGGISETSRATTLSDPTYVESGVIHFCVPNMPAMVPKTATIALTNQSLPWLLKILEKGLDAAIKDSLPIKKGIVCRNGVLTNKNIAESFAMHYEAI